MGLADTHDDLQAALSGSPQALARLLDRLRHRLVVWVSGRLSASLKAQVEPEDVVQDILLAVHRDFPRFHGRQDPAFFRWLFTVAENRIRDLADRVGALKRRLPPPTPLSQTSPSAAASRREEVERVMRAMATIPEAHREVLLLVKVEERPVAEVATLLRKTENAVRILYCRALKDLRSALGAPADPGARNRDGRMPPS